MSRASVLLCDNCQDEIEGKDFYSILVSDGDDSLDEVEVCSASCGMLWFAREGAER